MGKTLNDLAAEVFENAKAHGFHDAPVGTGTALMLIVSELGEALEADRVGRHADMITFDSATSPVTDPSDSFVNASFEDWVKDSFEDEVADALIRILDLCGSRGIDIDRHVRLKMQYNISRPIKHGKKY